MPNWKQQLTDSERDLAVLSRRFGLSLGDCRAVAERYPVAITPYYLSLIENPHDPIGLQCLPDPREIERSAFLLDDPLGEQRHAAGGAELQEVRVAVPAIQDRVHLGSIHG